MICQMEKSLAIPLIIFGFENLQRLPITAIISQNNNQFIHHQKKYLYDEASGIKCLDAGGCVFDRDTTVYEGVLRH